MDRLRSPATPSQRAPSGVSVIIATYNHAHYLAAALDSVMAQTLSPDEIIVVDDGSTDDPSAVTEEYPNVLLKRQANAGLSAARNAGLKQASAQRVLFLDADDLLTPEALAAGVSCFDTHPSAGFVYGGHMRVDDHLIPIGGPRFTSVAEGAHARLLTGNHVGMHATVLYDRAKLLSAGGFDTRLRRCEDYDVYLRMSRLHPIASHSATVALYRIHGVNMSSNSSEMLRWAEYVLWLDRRRGFRNAAERRAWETGMKFWRRWYADEIIERAGHGASQRIASLARAMSLSPRHIAWRAVRAGWQRLPQHMVRPIRKLLGRSRKHLPLGTVDLGDLNRTQPVSIDFGWDRGKPIDRYYVERFLEQNAKDIRGRALEIGDASYCRRFGQEIEQQDVLHVSESAPQATIVGDLARAGTLPEAAFDSIVLIQTLHLIYDMKAAVEEVYRALKPGGILLLTVPGISPIDRGEWGHTWYWSLTGQAAQRLFSEVFGIGNFSVGVDGNVYAATCFLQGLVLEEVDRAKLDEGDPCYPVIVSVRARRLDAVI
ncbi:glycosyltransferase [Altererythrobacter sp. SALINAS58]|uniref:glycosyltransferase n=1 Tax=Alteripontixanthobacter muriae TaxID=2705546 RepID=UPI001576FD1A|nr:glycosyltransferase [Alteripontixanthobacter muriae]NTZ42339.1 glycosyltransferase [Alteripontixanthobacter muriae]